MRELQEWVEREATPALSPCPYCGNVQDEPGGKVRMDAVAISHEVRRAGWAALLPAELQYRETWRVCCLRCGGCGGCARSVDEAAAAWNRRA